MKAKSARGASTRQRILETAAKLMYKNGVNGTSVDDVLQASGTGKSQFYHYFTNKEALVKELIDFHLQALPAAQASLLDNLGSVAGIEAWLDRIVVDYKAGVYSQGCPIGNLASELAGQNEELRQNLQATFAHWETRLQEGLTQMRAKGQLRPGVSPVELATFCVAAIEGALLLAKTNQNVAPLEATVAQMKAHIKGQSLGATRRLGPGPIKKATGMGFCP
jgi:TetR/AcrR family transcriptional repressor of nem operon